MDYSIRIQVFKEARNKFRAVATTTPESETVEVTHKDHGLALYEAAVQAGKLVQAQLEA